MQPQSQAKNSSDQKWMDMSQAMQICIENCTRCYQVCTHAMTHLFIKGNQQGEVKQLRLLDDCAKICSLSADFMIRHSDQHEVICKACAEICEQCADSCEAMTDGGPLMKACAEACRLSAQSCDQMAQMQ